jgi:Cu/Ag efflux protein CusF
MQRLIRPCLLAILLPGLPACGQPEQPNRNAPGYSDASGVAQSASRPSVTGSRIGQGNGRVVDIDGDALIIEHGPLSGVDMGAMTMRFETVYAVSAVDFEAGDEVAFRVKKGRDRVYRIIALCAAPQGGTECLGDTGSH